MARKYLPVRVVGNSMLPTLQPGDFLLVKRTQDFFIGDLVVVLHGENKLIKRVVDEQQNQIWLSGDNVRESNDSRNFGWMDKNQVFGKVILRYWPKIKIIFKVN